MISALPSRFKSRITILKANWPGSKKSFVMGAKEIVPLVLVFLRRKTSFLVIPPLVATRSGLPSPLRSPHATLKVGVPVTKLEGVKLALPGVLVFLKSIMSVDVTEFYVLAKSGLPSPSRSQEQTSNDSSEPVENVVDPKTGSTNSVVKKSVPL